MENNVQEIISKTEIQGLTDYLGLARKIDDKGLFDKAPQNRKIKIAILESFTLEGVREALLIKCLKEGIYPLIYTGSYNQYNQEILDSASNLYDFKPNIVILDLDTRTVAGENYFQLDSDGQSMHGKAWIKSTLSTILGLVQKIQENSKASILLHNFEVPTYSPLGIIDNKQSYSFRQLVQELNSELRDVLRNDPRTFLFDFERFASKIGKDNLIDYKMFYLGDFRINPKVIPDLCGEYVPYIRALLSMTKKCLVLDLDGVLWGGVIGEDGLSGIKLGPTPEGQPFLDLQKYILSLYNRGVILAINSANNVDDAMEVFRKHPYMMLKEDHFAAMQINWQDKVSNLKAIAEQVEIGIDSLVFVDDNHVNREVVKQALPEVLTIDLPSDPSLYPKTIMDMHVFDSLQLTSEDKVRGKMYAEQRKRQEFQRAAGDINEYLKVLQTVVTIEKASKFNIPRISQLTQKTNQFNVTTRRYMEDDITKMAGSDNFLVVSVKVEDKFGDSGLTGLAIIEKDPQRWRIDSFLLSCRVLGRNVEDTLLAYIIEQAAQEGARVLVGEFIPTKKNAPAKDFFAEHGFSKVSELNGSEIWEYDLQQVRPFPQFVKVVVR
ncbi:MAG: HAD-IIIC family phosphatase [archaeon]|nr:HAD-IIIC family phosphatase [archaeon]